MNYVVGKIQYIERCLVVFIFFHVLYTKENLLYIGNGILSVNEGGHNFRDNIVYGSKEAILVEVLVPKSTKTVIKGDKEVFFVYVIKGRVAIVIFKNNVIKKVKGVLFISFGNKDKIKT